MLIWVDVIRINKWGKIHNQVKNPINMLTASLPLLPIFSIRPFLSLREKSPWIHKLIAIISVSIIKIITILFCVSTLIQQALQLHNSTIPNLLLLINWVRFALFMAMDNARMIICQLPSFLQREDMLYI